MAITQRRPRWEAGREMTLEAFLKLPEEKPALEFMDGVVVQKVSPNAPHARLQVHFGVLLERATEVDRRMMVFTEARMSVRAPSGARSLVPDISVYYRERLPRGPKGRLAEYLFVVPDIAIEIVSPGQTVRSQVDRCQWFVEHGATIALVVNPRSDTVTMVRLGVEPRVLRGDDPIDLSPVLPDFELTVQDLFDSLLLD